MTMLSPFSTKAAGMNRLRQLAANQKDEVRFILPKQDKYGISSDNPHFYFPVEKKSFYTLPIYIVKAFLHLNSRKPDVVYFYKPHPFTFLPVFLYKPTHPSCITIFDCDEWEPATLRDNDEPYYKQLFMELLSRFCFWFADKIIYTNEYIKEDKIPKEYWSKCIYLPNGVDTEKFKSSNPKRHEGFNIFLVSYLYKIKHIISVVDAVARVRSRVPGLMCIIIGDGPRKAELQEMVRAKGLQGSFHFLGVIPYDTMPKMLSSADVIIIPYSNLEGIHYQCNIKIFEFMALGIPIIASDVGEIRKYLEDGKAGYIIKPDSPEAIAEAIVEAYSNLNEAMQKAEYARKISVEKNDWKFRAEKLEGFINGS